MNRLLICMVFVGTCGANDALTDAAWWGPVPTRDAETLRSGQWAFQAGAGVGAQDGPDTHGAVQAAVLWHAEEILRNRGEHYGPFPDFAKEWLRVVGRVAQDQSSGGRRQTTAAVSVGWFSSGMLEARGEVGWTSGIGAFLDAEGCFLFTRCRVELSESRRVVSVGPIFREAGTAGLWAWHVAGGWRTVSVREGAMWRDGDGGFAAGSVHYRFMNHLLVSATAETVSEEPRLDRADGPAERGSLAISWLF
ncbi:hypothetical protein LBMAG53_07300 [Planctomycetota bacterium]|nr:hypothetical protein LBMAG53_07300 [Planctomycetota bacterium]